VKRDNQSLVVDDFMVTRWDGEFMPNGMVMCGLPGGALHKTKLRLINVNNKVI
jgi:hypothetical protein